MLLQSAETLRPCGADVAKIKGDEKDPSTCMRCKVILLLLHLLLLLLQGKTFEMERKLSKRSAWHPKCFSCNKCSTAFQNIHYVYEGKDDEIYCKQCYKKTFPENETPQIFADTGKVAAATSDSDYAPAPAATAPNSTYSTNIS